MAIRRSGRRHPGARVSDALALRHGPHLGDTAEHVHRGAERGWSWRGRVAVESDAGAHQVVVHGGMREDRGAARRVQQCIGRDRAEHLGCLEEAGVLRDRECGILRRVREVGEDPRHLDPVAGVTKRGQQRVEGLGQRAEPVQARVDLEVDAAVPLPCCGCHRANPIGVQHADIDACLDQRLDRRRWGPADDEDPRVEACGAQRRAPPPACTRRATSPRRRAPHARRS